MVHTYEHWMNYLAERYIGIFKEGALVMAATAGTPYILWCNTILHSVDLNNDLPCTGNEDFKSPNFVATGELPEFVTMMQWGCFAGIARPAGLLTDKHMGKRVIEGIYVGSGKPCGCKGIIIYNPMD